MISIITHDLVFKIKNKKLYLFWLKELASIHQKSLYHLNYIFCSDSYIKELNRKFLGHDYCTDVISFDHSDIYANGKISGDIFIGIETVRMNVLLYHVQSFEEELVRVMAHGLLHLFGYDDSSEELRIIMKEEEEVSIGLFFSIKDS